VVVALVPVAGWPVAAPAVEPVLGAVRVVVRRRRLRVAVAALKLVFINSY
jgi:hypothetical protein